MKKAIVVYDTRFGYPERIAIALAEGIKEKAIDVDRVKVDQVDINKLVECDFLAIGRPIHAFGLSKPMKDFLEKLKGVNLSGKKAFDINARGD